MSTTAYAAGNDCEKPLVNASAWHPTEAEQRAFVAKVKENSGPGKLFGRFDGGNEGTFVYLIPPDQVMRTLGALNYWPGKPRPSTEGYMELWNSSVHSLVAVLETEDHSLVTLLQFTRGADHASLIVRRLDAITRAANESDGYHLVWTLLHDAKVLHDTESSWTIEAMRQP